MSKSPQSPSPQQSTPQVALYSLYGSRIMSAETQASPEIPKTRLHSQLGSKKQQSPTINPAEINKRQPSVDEKSRQSLNEDAGEESTEPFAKNSQQPSFLNVKKGSFEKSSGLARKSKEGSGYLPQKKFDTEDSASCTVKSFSEDLVEKSHENVRKSSTEHQRVNSKGKVLKTSSRRPSEEYVIEVSKMHELEKEERQRGKNLSRKTEGHQIMDLSEIQIKASGNAEGKSTHRSAPQVSIEQKEGPKKHIVEVNPGAMTQEQVASPSRRRRNHARYRSRQVNNNPVQEANEDNGDSALQEWITTDGIRAIEDQMYDALIDSITEITFYKQLGLCFMEFILFVLAYLIARELFSFQVLSCTIAAIRGLGAIFAGYKARPIDLKNRKARWKVMFFIDWLLLIQYYLCLTLKLQGVIKGSYSYSTIPGFFMIIGYMTFAEPPPLLKCPTIITRGLIWVQLVLISLKVDALVDISWHFAFVIVWIFLAILLIALIVSFFKFIILLSIWIKIRRVSGARSIRQTFIITLINLALLGVALITTYLLNDFLNYMNKDTTNRCPIKTSALVGVGYSGFLALVGLFSKNYIKKIYRLELRDRRLASRQTIKPPVINFISEEMRTLTLFVMISPTYFVPFDGPLINQEEDLIKWKKEIINIKSRKKLNLPSKAQVKIASLKELKVWSQAKRVAKPKEGNQQVYSYQTLRDEGLSVQNDETELVNIKLGLTLDDKDNIEALEKARNSILKIEFDEDEEHLCFVCYTRKANAIFISCGHGGVCLECAQETWTKRSTCMTCRKKIKKIVKYESIKGIDMVRELSEMKRNVEFQE